MKLLKTIKKIIEEAEDQYEKACNSFLPIEEIDKIEKHYKDSLKLLEIYKLKEEKKKKSNAK